MYIIMCNTKGEIYPCRNDNLLSIQVLHYMFNIYCILLHLFSFSYTFVGPIFDNFYLTFVNLAVMQ